MYRSYVIHTFIIIILCIIIYNNYNYLHYVRVLGPMYSIIIYTLYFNVLVCISFIGFNYRFYLCYKLLIVFVCCI